MYNEFIKQIPLETQLDLLDERLLNLRNELGMSRYGRSIRWSGEIEKEIEDTEYKRKLLLDKLSIKRHSELGSEENRPKIDQTKNWWESTLIQIIFVLAAIAAIITLFL